MFGECCRCKRRIKFERKLCRACAVLTAREFGFDEYAEDTSDDSSTHLQPPEEIEPRSPILLGIGYGLLLGLLVGGLLLGYWYAVGR